MKVSKLATLLITTTILLGLATASQAELTIFPEESSTEINSFTSYEVDIQNVGPVKDTYEIQHNYPGEISVAPTQIELESGETETFNVWFNPRVDRDAGTYSFRIDADSSADGQTYSTSGRVNVIKDHEVSVSGSDSAVVCRGETANYEIDVTNEGLQQEEFALTTEYGELDRDRVNLDQGESTTVVLTASSEEVAEENFNVKASSTTSYATETMNVQFNSENCFDSEVSISPETQDAAAFTESQFDVTVRNDGTRDDEFALTTDRGELSETVLDVDADSTETATLSFTPEDVGEQDITVNAEGNSESSQTVSVNSYNGMSSDVTFDESTTVCRDESAEYEAEIENDGEAEETYNLSSNIGALEEDQLTLDAGDSEEVGLTVNSSGMDDGEHTVNLESQATTFDEPTNSDETTLTVENCWDIGLDVVPEIASAGENMSTIYEINVENPGTRENTYRLTHQGPEWISIRPEEVTVGPGQTETVYMYAGVPFEKKGEVEITAVAEGNEVRATQKVDLVINEEVEEAIRSNEGRFVGRFSSSASGLYQAITEADNISRGIAAILAGLVITAVILVREW
ncbi:MAG: hypothetical protein R6V35_04195 [Candidatus Nanohaloarchaea archaeon]